MFLKSLTLKGFKSFAEATTLELQPGLTVVVGPNGSGKSNVVDAVAWVLGAQGPRALRSSRMEDVIFAGAANRPPLGRAEVSLTIDNSARLLPVDFTEVTVTRTLFRNDDSEYAINGVPCRLLDVQELLSDAGVGRQQHVIVSQGHLDAVLDSRPEGRRTLIEEAAGVHKYRRRREKAQRRLDATQDDLTRLQDLLREVRRQLRALERQADAARRHRQLEEERGGLRLYLAGRELRELSDALASAAGSRAELEATRSALAEEADRLDAEVAAAEDRAEGPAGEADDVLVAFERLRGRARGLAGLLVERDRALQRQLRDDGEQRLFSLDDDQHGLEADLEEVDAAAAALGPEADELARAEEALAAERSAFEAEWPEGPAPGARRAAEVRGEMAALHAASARSRAELERLEERRRGLEGRSGELAGELLALEGEMGEAEQRRAALAGRAAALDGRRGEAGAALAGAEADVASAEQRRDAWLARAEALASLLADEGAATDRLAAAPGALGTLRALVEVEQGWEAAFEAAVEEASSAVVVDGLDSARAALARARHEGLIATLLPADGPAPSPVPRAGSGTGPEGGAGSLRRHVRARVAGVDGLLDALLGPVVVVGGWEEGVELVLARPDLVAVTSGGDRFSARGWRLGPSTLRTRAALDEARFRARQAEEVLAGAGQRLEVARSEAAEIDSATAVLREQLEAHSARLDELSEARRRIEAEQAALATEHHSVRAHAEGLAERVAAEEARLADLAAALPALEDEEEAGGRRDAARRSARRHLDERAAALSALRTDLEVRAAALEERRGLLARRLEEVRGRLDLEGGRREAAARRREGLEAMAAATGRLAALVADRLSLVESRLEELHEQRRVRAAAARAAADHLAGLRRERAALAERLDGVRERARKVELEEAELRLRVEATEESLRRDLGRGREDALAAPCPELPEGTGPEERLSGVDEELRRLGPVNALALADHQALEERHRFLEGQLADVKSARQELGKVIAAIDSEISEVFAAAFADVSENFSKLFASLFPGGAAQLRLSDPDDLLGTGIEVEARPSGKRVGKLSLLSGGERSLTALAFLFAIFRSRPSPFYLLDEVEAALDDVNLNRFLELVGEFREEAQLVLVSHQKRTMEAADCLYGVTMQPGGSSRVVSERAPERAPAGAGGGPR